MIDCIRKDKLEELIKKIDYLYKKYGGTEKFINRFTKRYENHEYVLKEEIYKEHPEYKRYAAMMHWLGNQNYAVSITSKPDNLEVIDIIELTPEILHKIYIGEFKYDEYKE